MSISFSSSKAGIGRRIPRRPTVRRFGLAAVAVFAVIAIALPSNALAAVPANDSFANATIVSSLPFSDAVNLAEATTELGESGFCGVNQTVWYSFTAASDGVVRATTSGSSFFSATLNIYRVDGPGLGGLTWLTCGQFGQQAVFHVHAGTSYYIQGGSVFGDGGTLAVNLESVPPPPNDNFANAISINSLPFTDSQDVTGATTEPGEPLDSCAGQFTSTVWYSFTPSSSGSYSASASSLINGAVNVYTGSSLGSLTKVACGGSGGAGTFHADVGTTYYLQAGTFGALGNLQTNLNVAPPPAVGFIWGPGDPSIFDTVQFFDISFDPANIGIQTRSWDFADGTTATGQSVTHRFANDGDYPVKLTDTTSDGRTNSATNVIHVKTHDVAITSFLVPKTANAGKTAQLTVKLSDTRYPETVQVELFKSDPNAGFVSISQTTVTVQVGRGSQTTDFKSNYTFTSADASLGKLTFKAVATLIGARDALPADNTAIAVPTRVMP